MKFITVSAILILACISIGQGHLTGPEISKNVEKFSKECAKETGAAETEIENLKKGNFKESTEKLECFTKCLLEKAGFMMKDGKLNEKKIEEELQQSEPKNDAKKSITACKEIKGKNECQLAFNVLKCFSENKSAIIA